MTKTEFKNKGKINQVIISTFCEIMDRGGEYFGVHHKQDCVWMRNSNGGHPPQTITRDGIVFEHIKTDKSDPSNVNEIYQLTGYTTQR